jgi:Flp pilus assembly protein TadD
VEHGQEAVDELEERLRRHPVDRYPVQHATAQFHLGVLRARRGELDRAEAALAAAAALFPRGELPV